MIFGSLTVTHRSTKRWHNSNVMESGSIPPAVPSEIDGRESISIILPAFTDSAITGEFFGRQPT